MKLPGVGEVDKKWLLVGGGGVALVVVYGRLKARNAANATTATSTDSGSSDSIDPTTGVPYADEGGVYGYGATDPTTGVPYQYEGNTTTTTPTYTTNAQWGQDAISYGIENLGASEGLIQQAVADYLRNSPSGLPASEFDLISEIIALIGPPPVGTFRLVEQSGTGATGGNVVPQVKAGMTLNVPYNVAPGQASAVASRFGISLQHLLNNNPGKTGKETTTVPYLIPFLVGAGQTNESVAAKFGISVEHLQQYIPTS